MMLGSAHPNKQTNKQQAMSKCIQRRKKNTVFFMLLNFFFDVVHKIRYNVWLNNLIGDWLFVYLFSVK